MNNKCKKINEIFNIIAAKMNLQVSCYNNSRF